MIISFVIWLYVDFVDYLLIFVVEMLYEEVLFSNFGLNGYKKLWNKVKLWLSFDEELGYGLMDDVLLMVDDVEDFDED